MASPGAVIRASGAKRAFYRGWVVVAACLIIGTVAFTLRFSFGVFFKSLAADFDLNRAATSGIMSLHMVLCAVVAISGGWLVDRYGPRKTVAVMGFFIGLSLLLASQASALWHLYLSYGLLLAIGTGAVYSAIVSTASKCFIKRRGLAMAIVTSALGFGSVLQPVSALLIADFGWRTSYFLLALVGFFLVIPLAALLKAPTDDMLALHEGGKTPDTIHTGLQKGIGHGQTGRISLRQVMKTRNLWFSICMWFTNAFGIFIIVTHIVPHAIDLGISATASAAILSIAGGVGILGRMVMGRVYDNIGGRKAAVISILCMVAAMLWLLRASTLWHFYAFAVIFGVGWGGANASFAALVSDVFGLQRLGVLVGMMDAGFSIGAALGPAFAGYIFDILGSYFFAFLGGLSVMAMGVVLVLSLRMPAGEEATR